MSALVQTAASIMPPSGIVRIKSSGGIAREGAVKGVQGPRTIDGRTPTRPAALRTKTGLSRSKVMTRSVRLLAIVQSLRGRHAPATAAALASEFGVSERTIYRQVSVLVARGAVIAGAAGSGYIMKAGSFLPPMTFAPDEADAIVLGLRYVMRRGDAALSEGARSAMAKIADVMPEGAANRARANGLVVGPVGSRRNEVIAAIRSAIRRGRKLTFAYANAEGRPSSRTVWPIALGFFDEVEMLAAWCEAKGAFRHFRTDRIREEQVSEQRILLSSSRLMSRYREVEPDLAL
ncbi:putative DNA-binding transcriptional regulator YafY [Sphingomonas melonis]|uniref:Putative DNA-binding transcriptional regulator YafY n=2 Tax=Sphingomonas melonis TaxID=152682 RepID=A0A7Y9FL26_9SPHN|nr:putative DNA-binding transcriptional regulator YafY [Sphingomonas melonis]